MWSPTRDVVADLHDPDRRGPGGAVGALEADADLLQIREMVQRLSANRVTSATNLDQAVAPASRRPRSSLGSLEAVIPSVLTRPNHTALNATSGNLTCPRPDWTVRTGRWQSSPAASIGRGVRILGWRHGHAARRQPNPLAVRQGSGVL